MSNLAIKNNVIRFDRDADSLNVDVQSRNKESKVDVSFEESVNLILDNLRDHSKNTAVNYEGYYRQFFDIVLGKSIQDVTWKDILEVQYQDVLRYKNALQEDGNINKTINIKIASLNTLYRELKKINHKINPTVVQLSKLPERSRDSRSYGSLSEREVEGLFDYTMKLPKRQKPFIKTMFFKTAYVTAIRQGALLKLTWGDIKQKEDRDGNKIWVIEIEDKGEDTQTPITDSFYGELIELKNVKHNDGFRDSDTDRVFNITRKTLAKALSDYCEEVGIGEDRNIVIHSLKKSSMDKVYSETKDINMTARHGHHRSVNMTYEIYEGQNTSLADSPSYAMFDNDIDMKGLEDLSKEELLKAISNSGQGVINSIVENLK